MQSLRGERYKDLVVVNAIYHKVPVKKLGGQSSLIAIIIIDRLLQPKKRAALTILTKKDTLLANCDTEKDRITVQTL